MKVYMLQGEWFSGLYPLSDDSHISTIGWS